MSTYQPKLNIENGLWYAARPVPGCDSWHGEVECRTKSGAAKTACEELNRASERAQRELIKLNQQLGRR